MLHSSKVKDLSTQYKELCAENDGLEGRVTNKMNEIKAQKEAEEKKKADEEAVLANLREQESMQEDFEETMVFGQDKPLQEVYETYHNEDTLKCVKVIQYEI